jgi:tryptophan-rich sensory protein
MPFTFSHPAIVLPLRYLPKRSVSMTGLIIGSMAPDFEYFIRLKVESIYSHTWPGLFLFDLPLSLLLVIVYQILVKDALIEHLPQDLYRRVSRFRGSYKPISLLFYFIIVVLSILFGASSHILWDGFTHPNGYFVKLIPAFSNSVKLAGHQLFVYKIIQHTSTILGAIVIVLSFYTLPLGNPKKNNHIIGFWVQIVIVSFITLVIRLSTGLSLHQYGDLIVTAIAGCFLGLITSSITTKLKKRYVS